MRERPGENIRLRKWTSFVALAMMSPTRWREWKVWLFPSRLVKSSALESRSMCWARTSKETLRADPRDSLNGGRPGDEEGDRGELGDLPAGLGEHVEALADEDLEPRIADIVRDREESAMAGSQG